MWHHMVTDEYHRVIEEEGGQHGRGGYPDGPHSGPSACLSQHPLGGPNRGSGLRSHLQTGDTVKGEGSGSSCLEQADVKEKMGSGFFNMPPPPSVFISDLWMYRPLAL